MEFYLIIFFIIVKSILIVLCLGLCLAGAYCSIKYAAVSSEGRESKATITFKGITTTIESHKPGIFLMVCGVVFCAVIANSMKMEIRGIRVAMADPRLGTPVAIHSNLPKDYDEKYTTLLKENEKLRKRLEVIESLNEEYTEAYFTLYDKYRAAGRPFEYSPPFTAREVPVDPNF